jgi:hypothetical protein
MPISAVDALNPAFEHTKKQLFQPFRLGQWTRLALVGLFAGEMTTGGGGGGPNFQVPAGHPHGNVPGMPHIDFALLIPLIIMAVIGVALLWLLFLYINSRMRFILFDSVVARKCEVRRMWRARRGPALQYFLWQIVFSLVAFAGIVVVVGIPALGALLLGWFSHPHEHIAGLILTGVAVFFAFMACIVLFICVHVFTKDFVVPQMALENISAFEGWRRLLPMLRAEKGGYAGYAGMKIVMALGAAFAVTVVVVILVLMLLIPIGGVGLLSVLFGKAAGLTWNVFTITLVVVAGCMFLLVLFYGAALISVPVIVYFPAYSIYFFASRYQPLANLIYPPPPPTYSPPVTESPA